MVFDAIGSNKAIICFYMFVWDCYATLDNYWLTTIGWISWHCWFDKENFTSAKGIFIQQLPMTSDPLSSKDTDKVENWWRSIKISRQKSQILIGEYRPSLKLISKSIQIKTKDVTWWTMPHNGIFYCHIWFYENRWTDRYIKKWNNIETNATDTKWMTLEARRQIETYLF